MARARKDSRNAFTLTELLIVVGIIALLVGLLLPTVMGAWAQANATACASNIRQIDIGLQNYASENHGLYPPNNLYDAAAGATANWCDEDRIGRYVIGKAITTAPPGYGQLGGPLFTCPYDDRSVRSYSMNIWASCVIDPSILMTPPQGTLFRGSSLRVSSSTILIAERWSTSLTGTTYFAPPTIGVYGTKPGLRFGAGGGVVLTNTHWRPNPNSELAYMWHRRRADGGTSTQAYGRVNIGYGDGHVGMKSVDDLVDRNSALSTMDSVWSPLDRQQNY